MSHAVNSEAIEQFWGAFTKFQQILSVPGDHKDSEMMEMLRILQRIDARLYFHVGYRDEGLDLLLSAEGHIELSPTVVACISRAPSSATWRIRPIPESEALFGKRNAKLFPHDENGDALFAIASRGGDLITSKEVDFCHVFPSEPAARSFAAELGESEYVNVKPYRGAKGFSWEAQVTREMLPTHSNITQAETALGDLARRFEGRSDGWGFMSE